MSKPDAADLYRLAFEGSTDAMVLFDGVDGAISEVNPAATELYGYDAEAMKSLTVDDLCADIDEEEEQAGVVPLLERHVRKDGEALSVDVSIGSVDQDGQALGVMAVRDITERRRMEDELRARRLQERLEAAERIVSLGRLAAGVAHEINNPLTFVIGNAIQLMQVIRAAADRGDPLREAELTGMLEQLEDIVNGSRRIHRIVTDLNTFARGDQDRQDKIDLNRVINAIAVLTRSEFEGRAELILEHGELPPMLGNESQLGQVVLNLIVNAAEAIEPGNPDSNTVRVRTELVGDDVRLQVSDTGSGIPAQDLPRVFDPFFSSKGMAVASGLGLSVVHGIVRGLGGRVDVASEVGKGTTFYVTLPRAPAAT